MGSSAARVRRADETSYKPQETQWLKTIAPEQAIVLSDSLPCIESFEYTLNSNNTVALHLHEHPMGDTSGLSPLNVTGHSQNRQTHQQKMYRQVEQKQSVKKAVVHLYSYAQVQNGCHKDC